MGHKSLPQRIFFFALLALATCADGAVLATASCSQLVDDATFERMLAGAAKDAHRSLQVTTHTNLDKPSTTSVPFTTTAPAMQAA